MSSASASMPTTFCFPPREATDEVSDKARHVSRPGRATGGSVIGKTLEAIEEIFANFLP